ncbi:MAG: hypothetical protein KGQ59_06400 [Bdellovibrionales bacterium]|nr:hypothetical protein [Bdellovibrionales bacterium]
MARFAGLGFALLISGFTSVSWGADSIHPRVQSIEADETRIYTNQPKKLDIRVSISASTEETPGSKWNLVQVDAEGHFVRYIGILFFNQKKGIYFRKLELQERIPGKRFFEVVTDRELEPFVQAQRPRLEIEILHRPTLTEILTGLWKKLVGWRWSSDWSHRSVAAEGVPTTSPRNCSEKIQGSWLPFKEGEGPKTAQYQKGTLSVGGVYAALRAETDLPLKEIVEQLWNPAQLKNPRNTKLKLSEVIEANGVKKREVDVNVRPFLFVNLDWKESWVLRELRPGEIYRIEYSKIAGEERLKHFCGWMEVKKLSSSRAELVFLEEIEASHRSPEDVLNGHLGTLDMLNRVLKAQ